MGTHSKTLHKAGTITPGLGLSAYHGGLGSSQAGQAECLNAAVALQELISHCKEHPGPEPGQSLTDWYDDFAVKAKDAAGAIELAEAAGGDVAATSQMRDMLWVAVSGTLNSLGKNQLTELSALHGFEHPLLAAAGNPDVHPLSHWLDPAYPADAPSKILIQAKAHERYAALCNGQVIGGMDLAALHALEGTHMPGASVPVHLTPAEVAEARAEFADALSSIAGMLPADGKPADPELGQAYVKLLTAKCWLESAYCPELDAELETWKAEAADEYVKVAAKVPAELLSEAVAAGQADGLITAGQAAVLPPSAALLLVHPALEPEVKHEVAAMAAANQQKLAELQAAYAKFTPFKPATDAPLNLPQLGITGPDGPDPAAKQVAAFAVAAGGYVTGKSAVSSWAGEVPGLHGPDAAAWLQPASDVSPEALSQEFRAWGKHQDLSGLQNAAAVLGLEHAPQASKVHALKYIAAHWDPAMDKAAIQHEVTGSSEASSGSTTPVIAASAPEPVPASPLATPAGVAAAAQPSGFVAKHKRLVAALAQAKATATDLPARLNDKDVASFSFGQGQAALLGGMHAKTVHDGPDGGKWLFKADNQAKGARAHAEADASALFAAGGVPSVPVYVVRINGKPGAIQPLVHGATQLDPNPKTWTQAQADAIVRGHVAAWMAGDHDGKPDNQLCTPSGGMVPIDQGQAFKFYGSDKLDMAFHPNATYGAERPVYHQLYEAHLAGALGAGVKINPAVAHPVIKAYEKIPDAQLRAMLHHTAHKGAASGVVSWIPAMRARAAKKHGIAESAVTTDQVAEAFLVHACERKNGLRAAFADFFTQQVKLPAAAALRYAS